MKIIYLYFNFCINIKDNFLIVFFFVNLNLVIKFTKLTLKAFSDIFHFVINMYNLFIIRA